MADLPPWLSWQTRATNCSLVRRGRGRQAVGRGRTGHDRGQGRRRSHSRVRPTGTSMMLLIRSGQRITVASTIPSKIEVGDIVLARVAGTPYLHLAAAVD